VPTISRGYLTLSPSSAAIDDWVIGTDGDTNEQIRPDHLRDWNYYQAVTVKTVLNLDVSACRADLELKETDDLCAAILWSSAGTNLRGKSDPVSVVSALTPIELLVEPGELRGQIQVEVVLALRRAGASTHPLAAKRPGSVVWSSSRFSVDLEGLGSRMPVVAFPFSRRLAHSANAQWWLSVRSTDLDRPADGVLWMWLNEEHPYVKALLVDPETEPSERTALHLSADFHRQLLQMAITSPDLDMAAEYDRGSLGASLVSIVRLLEDDLESLRTQYASDPWLVEARMQAAIPWNAR
jgi:hypothetical protein